MRWCRRQDSNLDARLSRRPVSLPTLAGEGPTRDRLPRVYPSATATTVILACLLLVGVAHAADTGGPIFRDTCAQILHPVTNKSLCWEQTTATLKYWNGSAWIGPPVTCGQLPALTGPITTTGCVTSIASQTGTGTTFVMQDAPTIVTPSIAKLANLTSNGFVQTSGGDGTLGITAVGVSQTFTMCKTGACATTCTVIVTNGIVTGGTC